MQIQHKLTPLLWYERGAEDAVAHYLQTLGDGRVLHTQRWGENAPGPARVQRVFQALWAMEKIDIAALQRAYG